MKFLKWILGKYKIRGFPQKPLKHLKEHQLVTMNNIHLCAIPNIMQQCTVFCCPFDLGQKIVLYFSLNILSLYYLQMIQHKMNQDRPKQRPAWYKQVAWFNFSWLMLCIDWCMDSLAKRKSFPINKNLFQEIYTNWLELVVLFQYTQKWIETQE